MDPNRPPAGTRAYRFGDGFWTREERRNSIRTSMAGTSADGPYPDRWPTPDHLATIVHLAEDLVRVARAGLPLGPAPEPKVESRRSRMDAEKAVYEVFNTLYYYTTPRFRGDYDPADPWGWPADVKLGIQMIRRLFDRLIWRWGFALETQPDGGQIVILGRLLGQAGRRSRSSPDGVEVIDSGWLNADEEELRELEHAVATLKAAVAATMKSHDWIPESPQRPAEAPTPASQPELVTLNQAAGMAHRKKRTLERYKTKGKLPAPAVEGGGGKPDLYDWKVMRPWLTETFGVNLPEHFTQSLRR
jgi:hypothetical protein